MKFLLRDEGLLHDFLINTGLIDDPFRITDTNLAVQLGLFYSHAFPTQGYVDWMDNVVLRNDAPNRDSAIAFMDFMLKPENIAEVSNYARCD